MRKGERHRREGPQPELGMQFAACAIFEHLQHSAVRLPSSPSLWNEAAADFVISGASFSRVVKMFHTSLRRAARSCPRGQPLPSSRPSTPSIAPFTSKSHQRRHSSSKPPIPPNNGSPAMPTSGVKVVGAAKSESKKPASDSRLSKRKTQKPEPREEVQDNWAATLPSVPSTQHLNQKGRNSSECTFCMIY